MSLSSIRTMKSALRNFAMGLGLALLAVASGCGKKSVASGPLPVEQVPQALETAFKNAAPETSRAANEAVSAVRDQDPGALTDLQELAARADLDEKQRIAATRAMAAYLQKLREAAEKGDKKSEEAIEHYRATK